LLYAFDFFYALYIDQIENYGADYEERDIPKLIIENNLHGIDLDDRAVQLAQLGLFIKAKKKQKSIGKLAFKIVSSDFFLPEYENVKQIFEKGNKLTHTQREVIENIWSDLHFAHKFGSLIRLNEKIESELKKLIEQRDSEQESLFSNEEMGMKLKLKQVDMFTEQLIKEEKQFVEKFFNDLKSAVEQYVQAHGNTFLSSKTCDAITFLEMLTTEFDVATTNPPYTDSADFGPELKKFIEENYKKPYKFHTNLYASFIKRCYEMTENEGKVAIIHPRTFMFIKTFEDVRKFIINKTQINVFVDYSLSNLFGAIMVDPAFYVLEKNIKEREAWFVSLDQYTRTPNEKYKKGFCLKALDDYIKGIENEHNYTIPQSKLKIIKSWPFIYWISDEFREKFGADSVEDYCKVAQGLITGQNERFLRFWWEIKSNTNSDVKCKKWIKYSKGGPFNKWYGNLWLTVNWQNDGAEIKTLKTDSGRQKSRTQNMQFYLKEGVTFSTTGSKGASFRYLPEGCIFDGKGSSVFPLNKTISNEYLLAFLNSKLSFYIANSLNSTVETTIGDVQRIPLIVPSDKVHQFISLLTSRNIGIKRYLCSFSLVETEYLFSCFSSISKFIRLGDNIREYLTLENHLLTQVLINEAIINEKIFEVYNLTVHDKAMVLAKEGESIGGLPVMVKARDAYLTETEATKEFPLDGIRDFIESLPTREFTAEEREEIESGFPTLYQSNNDLVEFCIRHHVNPINVWYWFKQSNVIPQQRMHTLAMEFLADMIREILMEDEDGIIPLVPNAGEKVLLDRIEEKFFERGFSSAQHSSFDTVLDRPIHEYLNKYFFAELSDHLNLFMYLPKTPFIWHLSSGPEQGFDCYIIIYKWSRDKLMRLRSVYIEHRERSLVNRQSDLAGNESAEAQNEKERIYKQLKEIKAFKAKIDELLAEGYNPILDDGVGKNIAPLQKKKMIPYEVLNAGQLKKYLKADW
jgi:hypothetical protein